MLFRSIKLGKIVNLLESKGEASLAEQIDTLIPEFIEFEKLAGDEKIVLEKNNSISGIPADKAYKMAAILRKKYLIGMINEEDFEYSKMKELEGVLKSGFLLPAPVNYNEDVKNTKQNWWEYFDEKTN